MSRAIPAIPNSYWVVPGRFAAGAYPGGEGEDLGEEMGRGLLEAGIDMLIDLTEAGEAGLGLYAPKLVGEAAARGRSLEHRRFSISDMSVPSPARMAAILTVLDEALQAGKNVYLHCYGGKGRTGTVVGCYLAQKGLDSAAVLSEIASLRAGLPGDSPETEEQTQFVVAWVLHSQSRCRLQN